MELADSIRALLETLVYQNPEVVSGNLTRTDVANILREIADDVERNDAEPV